MLIGGFDVFKSRQVGLFSDHIPFESSNLSTVFLKPKTSGHLQPCDLNVYGPMKQSYRRKLNHQLFEKAKNLEAKVALTEYDKKVFGPDFKSPLYLLSIVLIFDCTYDVRLVTNDFSLTLYYFRGLFC